MFEFTPQITKKFLLDRKPAEAYFEFYLGVPVKKGLFCSPSIIRVDHKPTCSFYKNSKGTLLYNDFAGISGDFVTIVMEIFKVSYYKALNIIATDFGYIKLDNYVANTPKLVYTLLCMDIMEELIQMKMNYGDYICLQKDPTASWVIGVVGFGMVVNNFQIQEHIAFL